MSDRLNILWLSHFVPYPPKGGCFQRSYNLIARAGRVHDIHLIALRHKDLTHARDEVAAARTALLEHCATVEILDISRTIEGFGLVRRAAAGLATATPFNVAVYRSAEMARSIRTACASTAFDVVHYDTIGLAQYLPLTDAIPALMTHHGAESHMIHRRIRREPNLLKKAFFVFEWLALERYERKMCRAFGVNVVMSTDDGRLLQRVAPDAVFRPVENGVDTGFFSPHPARDTGRSLVFAGRLDQYSNRDGIQHFMKSVWPALTDAFPDARIDIIGSNPPESLRALAETDRRVNVTGFVPDVRPYFAAASVALCPVRDGGGTRIKVLDALAQAMPLVSTSIGCEGIDVVPERDVLIADSPEETVRQISRLFEDPMLRQRLGASGRSLVERVYSWDRIAEKLSAEYVGLATRNGRAPRPDQALMEEGVRVS